MAKVSNNLGDLKSLLGTNSKKELNPAEEKKETAKEVRKSSATKVLLSEDGVLHSYVSSIVNDSAVYDIMKDTEAEGKSFSSLSQACHEQISKDIVDYFACCFYEGEYSTLDTLAVQCEEGVRKDAASKASILGHTVSLTYEEEFQLLADLFSVALAIDKRMNDEQEETLYTYNRGGNQPANAQKTSAGKEPHSDSSSPQVYSSSTASPSFLVEKKAIKLPNKADQKSTTTSQAVITKPKEEFRKVSISKNPKRTPKPGGFWANRGIVSSPSMKRRSFSDHVASSGVWGRIADCGGHGHLIYINAGHGR